jgi:hypothetical protein
LVVATFIIVFVFFAGANVDRAVLRDGHAQDLEPCGLHGFDRPPRRFL